MQMPFVKEKWVGDELHLFLSSYDFLVEMGTELGERETRDEKFERTVLDYVQDKYPNRPLQCVKVFLGSMLVATLCVTGVSLQDPSQVAHAASEVGMVINGQVMTDAEPFNKGGQVMIPAYTLAKLLDMQITFNEAAKQVTLSKNGQQLSMTIDSNQATLNGKPTTLSVAPVRVGNVTYVPVRFVSEQFGGRVIWDNERQTVVVSSYQAVVYNVGVEDTLWTISQRYHTDVASIQLLNGLGTRTTIHEGLQFIVPRNATAYQVQTGDNLWKIAQRFHTSVDDIRQASALGDDDLAVGQVLLIPRVAGGTTPTPTPTPAPAPARTGEYIVQPGDTLWGLAERYNITVEQLRRLNGLTSDSLHVGQRVQIPGYTPAPPPPAESYLQHMDPAIAAQLANANFTFPFATEKAYDPFRDTWGDSRGYNPGGSGVRPHQGTDIFAPGGSPLYAVGDGKIVNYGWNELGGWRVTVQLDNTHYTTYYAHLSRYAPGLGKGVHVKKGQLLGYVGNTGYGPVGTSGKFVTHLHFGLYDTSNGFVAVNPYQILKYWEAKKF